MKAIILVVGLAFLPAASAVAAPATKAPQEAPMDGAPERQTRSALRIRVRPEGPVSPGQTVEVTVEGSRTGPLNALLVSPGDPEALDVKELPFTARITIPRESVGSFLISVTMAANPGAALFGPGSVTSEKTLSVKVPVALQRLEVLPTEVRFDTPGDYRVLYVYGHYEDGVDGACQ